MAISTQNITLGELVEDLRVQEYLRKREREIKIQYRDYAKNYHSQITSCHAWLLLFHYETIHKLSKDYYFINRPEFIVLLGAYTMKRLGNHRFRAKQLSTTLLLWEYNRIYRHLRILEMKGFIRTERYSKTNFHKITYEGEKVIRSFSQHFWQVFSEAREKLGVLPVDFESIIR